MLPIRRPFETPDSSSAYTDCAETAERDDERVVDRRARKWCHVVDVMRWRHSDVVVVAAGRWRSQHDTELRLHPADDTDVDSVDRRQPAVGRLRPGVPRLAQLGASSAHMA